MGKFYLFLWLRWAFIVTFLTLLLASVGAFGITLFIYLKQGAIPLDRAVYEALFKIFSFWFALSWTLSLLISLFASLKYLFHRCYGSYRLLLLDSSCGEHRNRIRVWRRWFMLLIWFVLVQVIIVFVAMKLFRGDSTLFDWFNIYLLYGFIMIGGYFSLVTLSGRCKKIRIVKC